MKFCYRVSLTIPKQSQRSRSILSDGSRFWDCFGREKLSLITEEIGYDGWIDDLQFYVLFSSILVISGQWKSDNERLCAV